MKVLIVATAANIAAGRSSQLINMFDGKDTGFIKLQQSHIDMSNPVWPKEVKRITTMKGTKELLTLIVQQGRANAENGVPALPGRLQLVEVLATDIPDNLRQLFFRKDQDEDQNIQDYAKKAGNEEDAPVLTLGDVPILHFTVYDDTASKADVTLAHDNVDEVREYAQLRRERVASLPDGARE